MGFLSKLFGLGAVAGAAVAAAKVAQKYEENKQAEVEAMDPEVPAPATDTATVLSDVAKAATDVLGDACRKAKGALTGAAAKAGVDTDEVTVALTDAGKAVVDAGKVVANAGVTVANKVVDEAPELLEKAEEKASDALQQVKDALANIRAEDDVQPEEAQLANAGQPEDNAAEPDKTEEEK